jgi:hypothetical protein
MSTDDLPEAIATKARPVFRLRAITVDGEGFLPEGPTVGAVRASPRELSDRQKQDQKQELHRRNEWNRLDREYAEIDPRKGEAAGPPYWRGRFLEPFWNYFEALSWMIYRLPEKLHEITSRNYRSVNWYGGEDFEQRRREFLREWQLGTIKAFIRGSEIKPAAAVDPTSLTNDPDLVFQASTLTSRWPTDEVDSNTLQSPTVVAATVVERSVERRPDPIRVAKLSILHEMIDEGYRPRRGPHNNIKLELFSQMVESRYRNRSAMAGGKHQISEHETNRIGRGVKRIPPLHYFAKGTIRKDLRVLSRDPVYGPKLNSPACRPSP